MRENVLQTLRVIKRVLRNVIIVVLVIMALLSGTALAANYLLPLAVLQTVGLVYKASLGGAEWKVDFRLHEGVNETYEASINTRKQNVVVGFDVFYRERQVMPSRSLRNLGPLSLRVFTSNFRPEHQGKYEQYQSMKLVSLRCPLWGIFVLSVSYPIVAFIYGPLRRRRRRKYGQCLDCGYDLRGLVEPRCPECATPFTATNRQKPYDMVNT